MYALWWNNGPTFVARRAGPSGSWQAPQQVSGAETSGGSDGGDIKTNTFGDVFAFWPSEGTRELYVSKSTDGGANWGGPVKIADTNGAFLIHPPAQAGRGALLYITAGAYRTATEDRVYACWADLAGGAGCNAQANEPGQQRQLGRASCGSSSPSRPTAARTGGRRRRSTTRRRRTTSSSRASPWTRRAAI